MSQNLPHHEAVNLLDYAMHNTSLEHPEDIAAASHTLEQVVANIGVLNDGLRQLHQDYGAVIAHSPTDEQTAFYRLMGYFE